MTTLDAQLTIINVYNDSLQLGVGLGKALKSTNEMEAKKAWEDVLVNTGKVISGLVDLGRNVPGYNSWLGGASNLGGLQKSWDDMKEDYDKGSLCDIKAKDLLGYVGGLADFASSFLLIPGAPTFAIGLALKGLGTTAALGQHAVGDKAICDVLDDDKPPLPPPPGVGDDTERFGDAENTKSPLILDLNGDGVKTLNKTAGKYFDHAGDGFAERTGWVDKDDGLLVRDLNGDGKITSGRELFGNHTVLKSGKQAANGFEALKDLDSNTDGLVDDKDAGFASLRVWKDANGNGLTVEGELLTLAQASNQALWRQAA
jgi:hypothetical protein